MCGTGCVMDTVFILSNCIETQELEFSLFSEIKLRLRNDVYQDAPMVQTHGRCSVYSYSFHFPLPPSFPPPPSLPLFCYIRPLGQVTFISVFLIENRLFEVR